MVKATILGMAIMDGIWRYSMISASGFVCWSEIAADRTVVNVVEHFANLIEIYVCSQLDCNNMCDDHTVDVL